VELAKQSGHRFASRMVNAVLRKLAGASDGVQDSAENDSALKGHVFRRAEMNDKMDGALVPEENLPKESAAELALTESHPTWMVERWANFYGLGAALAICRHGQTQPVLSIRLASPTVEAELIEAGIQLSPGELLTAGRTILSGDVAASRAFHEGRMRLQDEGSQLIAELACDSLNQKEQIILDACAAPGGKTLILAERNPEARIVACESSAQRLDELRHRLAAHADKVECRLADVTAFSEDSVFDLALADVPCSGTGTLGRNPEIRHRLHPEDLPRQAERQRAILHAALRAVRPGGRVLYSTCSLEPEENEQVVAKVLASNPNARQISLAPRIEALRSESILNASGAEQLHRNITPEGTLRLLPGAFHTDGFFVALLERTV
jgi:16S rRNA (cytosine967-C5)-methyltransferase